MAHEEEQHQQHEDGSLEERPPDGAESRRHQFVAVVEGHDLDLGWQRLPGQFELLLDSGDHITARPTAQHEHDPGHGLPPAVAADGALPDLGRELHGGHLAEQHRDVVAVGNHGVLEVLTVPEPTVSADHELFAAAFDKGPAGDAVVGRYRRCEFLERESVLAQRHRVRHHVKLADIPAEAVDPSNSRHGAEDGPQDPVLQRPQLHQIEVGAFESVLVDLAETGGDRPETAGGALGQLTLDGEDPLHHQLAGEVDIGSVLEHHGHHRETEFRERSHLGRVRKAGTGLLDRVGDELFNFER